MSNLSINCDWVDWKDFYEFLHNLDSRNNNLADRILDHKIINSRRFHKWAEFYPSSKLVLFTLRKAENRGSSFGSDVPGWSDLPNCWFCAGSLCNYFWNSVSTKHLPVGSILSWVSGKLHCRFYYWNDINGVHVGLRKMSTLSISPFWLREKCTQNVHDSKRNRIIGIYPWSAPKICTSQKVCLTN